MELPWPRFVNQGLYIQKTFVFIRRFQNWFLPIFVFIFKVNVTGQKGHSLQIDGINDCIMFYGRYSAIMWSEPGNVESKYITLVINTTFK